MKIERIKLQNYRSYQNLQIDMNSYDSIIGIFGKTGSGKSSIIESVPYCIWGDFRDKSEDDIIYENSDQMIVEVDFVYKMRKFKVIRKKSRGKTATADLFIDDVKKNSVSNISAVNSMIVDELGFSYDIFNSTSFFRQGRCFEFIESSPSERRSAISKIIDTDIFLDASIEAKKKKSICGSRIDDLNNSRKALELTFSSFESKHGSVENANSKIQLLKDENEKNEIRILELRQSYFDINSKIQRIESSNLTLKDSEQRSCNSLKSQIDLNKRSISEILKQIEVYQSEKLKYESAVDKRSRSIELGKERRSKYSREYHDGLISRISSLKTRRDILKREIKTINSTGAECVQCFQKISDDHKHSFLEEKELEIKRIEEDLKCEDELKILNIESSFAVSYDNILSTDIQKNSIIDSFDIEERKKQIDSIEKMNIDLSNQLDQKMIEIKKLDDEIRSLDSLKIDRDTARKVGVELAELKKRNEHTSNVISSEIQKFEEERVRLFEVCEKIKKEEVDFKSYSKLSDAFGVSIPSMIIENVCDEIAVFSNEILEKSKIGFSICFKTIKVNKSGETKESIEIEITNQDKSIRKYESLSGGQKAIVNFAIRLGLSKLASESNDAKIETIFLDEVFSGIDSENMVSIISLLTYLKSVFKNIFIVTHDEDMKSFLPQNISVSMNGASSVAS